MNIFYLDHDPRKAAEFQVDRHVVKMPLETAQLLSTAHRCLDGPVWADEVGLYKATHISHPCAVWVRESVCNYKWLYSHFLGLLDEYTQRYHKTHACEALTGRLWHVPDYIPQVPMTKVRLAMPDEYKVESPVESYRNYYRVGKAHLHSWKTRGVPQWIEHTHAL